MAVEAPVVQANLNGLVRTISAGHVDVQIVLLAGRPIFSGSLGICVPAPLGSGSCPDDTKLPGLFHHPSVFVDSNNAAVQLVSKFSDYAPALRAAAKKHLVIVSDDDSKGNGAGVYSNDASRFITDYTNLDPSLKDSAGGPAWRMSGMYGQTQCTNAAQVGQVWKAIIDQTGGVHGDICACTAGPACAQALQSWMANVATRVIADAVPLDCEWGMPTPPLGQTLDVTKVNLELTNTATGGRQIVPHVSSAAACDARGGWYYDHLVSPSAIIACPVSCDAIKATPQPSLTMLLGCTSIPPR